MVVTTCRCKGWREPSEMPLGAGIGRGLSGLGRELWVFSQNALTYRKIIFPLKFYRRMVNRGSEFSSAMAKRAGGWVVLVRSHLVMCWGDWWDGSGT